jgi:hypothetical protein
MDVVAFVCVFISCWIISSIVSYIHIGDNQFSLVVRIPKWLAVALYIVPYKKGYYIWGVLFKVATYIAVIVFLLGLIADTNATRMIYIIFGIGYILLIPSTITEVIMRLYHKRKRGKTDDASEQT